MPFNPRYDIDPRGRAIPAPDRPDIAARVGLGINTLVPAQRAATILDWRGDDNNAADVRLFVGADDGVLNPYDYINALIDANSFPPRGVAGSDKPAVCKVIFGVGGVSNEFYMDASPMQSVVLPASYVRVEGVNTGAQEVRFSATITRSQGAGKNTLYLTQILSTPAALFNINIPPYARSVRFYKGSTNPAGDIYLTQGPFNTIIPDGVRTWEYDIFGTYTVLTLSPLLAPNNLFYMTWRLEL